MPDSVWPHRWQTTRLHGPWDFPGKNTGVGCHFYLPLPAYKLHERMNKDCFINCYNKRTESNGSAFAFDCVGHNKLWKILQEMQIPDDLTCLPRNMYAGQGATVKTKQEKTEWFKNGEGMHKVCVLSPQLLNF